MKPGKPLTFATIDVAADTGRPARRLLAFGLPGNPVSSLVTFHLVVLPALHALAGWRVRSKLEWEDTMMFVWKRLCLLICLQYGLDTLCCKNNVIWARLP